ncbi:MAG TPA: family 16 glycosylhydrolase [Flavitalea sp.]|nr:family 16 glycosylhydrolase [Flavitalea sp.]
MKNSIIIGLICCAVLPNCKKSESASKAVSITLTDVTAPELNGGTTNFEFILSLNEASSKPIDLTYSTTELTARAGEDFIAANGQTVTIAAGETQKKILIRVVADDLKEADEQFSVVLSNVTNATVKKSSAIGKILNDDSKVGFTNDGYDAPTTYAGYTLSWKDDFDGPALNTAAWSFQNGDGCPALCGWGNNELEYYTDRTDNLFFQDGKLIIEAKNELFNNRPYTSSKIISAGKKSFKFGRIDIRAKLPKGKGIWPALWLLPQNNVYGGWPTSGEIDLMEMIGHEANRVYGTAHYGQAWPNNLNKGGNYTLFDGVFNDQFHVFSIEWKVDQIKWFVDNTLFFTLNKSDVGTSQYPFNEEFYFIINLAVGGNWPGSPDGTTYFPQWLIVDYVRVYQ